MDGEPDPTSSGPGPGGETPDDPNAVWRRPGVEGPFAPAAPATPTAEGQQPPAPQGVVGRLTTWVRSWWHDLEFVQMWHVVAVAAILATAGFGGLDQVDKTPQSFVIGEPFDNGEFSITVHKASLVKQIVGGGSVVAKQKPGRMYLGVLADITNQQHSPDVASSMFKIPEISDAQNPVISTGSVPAIYRVSDGSLMNLLQPGLTERVAVVWSVPDTVTPGSSVSLELPYRTFSRGFVQYGEGWVEKDDSAKADISVGVPS